MVVKLTFPEAVTFTEVQCGEGGQWQTEGRPFTCAILCLDDPQPAPETATSSWDNHTRVAGTEVEISCLSNRVFKDLNNSHTVTCREDGNWTTIDPDILVCRTLNPNNPPPPPPGSVMRSPDPPFWVGDVVTYTCNEGLMSPNGTTSYTIYSRNYGWSYLDPAFGCFSVCSADPLLPVENMNSSWNGVNRVVGAVVQYTCDEGRFFGNLKATVNMICEESGKWTEIDPEIFFCRIPVPEAPPPTPPGAIMVGPDPPYWVPAAISFICREDQLSPLNTTNYTIFGNESGWSYLDPDFGCYNVCEDDPVEAPERAESNWNGFSKIEGTQVQYTCEEDHVFADFSATLSITCEGNGNWSSVDQSILICRIRESEMSFCTVEILCRVGHTLGGMNNI
ncbi:complement factor H-related protein 4-like [Penaeus monodon]|uniref:complement factor H-related protein 4-like n=1 Tax=Penaeus monodon TaxID=6687 RepID=UPI0018A753D1|nr:complement factor H-related protein 4-like [Penaeus monodon]